MDTIRFDALFWFVAALNASVAMVAFCIESTTSPCHGDRRQGDQIPE